jgi:hypothetical protein
MEMLRALADEGGGRLNTVEIPVAAADELIAL